jgi:hypothetical protein
MPLAAGWRLRPPAESIFRFVGVEEQGRGRLLRVDPGSAGVERGQDVPPRVGELLESTLPLGAAGLYRFDLSVVEP